MREQRAGFEVFEVTVVTAEMSDVFVVGLGAILREPQVAFNLVGLDIKAFDDRVVITFENLYFAFEGQHDRFIGTADVFARGRLHVNDAEVRATRRSSNAKDLGFNFDGVTGINRCSESHVDVFEIRARVFRNVADGLTERDQHDQAGRADEITVAMGLRVASVF